MDASKNKEYTYCAIKRLLFKYNLVPESENHEKEFLKELAGILDL